MLGILILSNTGENVTISKMTQSVNDTQSNNYTKHYQVLHNNTEHNITQYHNAQHENIQHCDTENYITGHGHPE